LPLVLGILSISRNATYASRRRRGLPGSRFRSRKPRQVVFHRFRSASAVDRGDAEPSEIFSNGGPLARDLLIHQKTYSRPLEYRFHDVVRAGLLLRLPQERTTRVLENVEIQFPELPA